MRAVPAENAIRNPLTTTNALGQTTTTLYEVMGRLTASVDPLGDTTTYAYDASGLQTLLTDPFGTETDTGYNSGGLVTETIRGDGSSVQSDDLTNYDNAGNVTATRDGMGNWTDTAGQTHPRPPELFAGA
jgi:uncharacterized protein RhaS with RHS repeats